MFRLFPRNIGRSWGDCFVRQLSFLFLRMGFFLCRTLSDEKNKELLNYFHLAWNPRSCLSVSHDELVGSRCCIAFWFRTNSSNKFGKDNYHAP